MPENHIYANCKIDITNNDKENFRVILRFDNCIGEIIVDKPSFAPYRYVKMKVLSYVNGKSVFTWYDEENDTCEYILEQLCKGLNFAVNYK